MLRGNGREIFFFPWNCGILLMPMGRINRISSAMLPSLKEIGDEPGSASASASAASVYAFVEFVLFPLVISKR
jgi:hypothetical protein